LGHDSSRAWLCAGQLTPDVPLFHRLHYSVDKWRSPVVQYGADRPPTTEGDTLVPSPITWPATMWIFRVCETYVPSREHEHWTAASCKSS